MANAEVINDDRSVFRGGRIERLVNELKRQRDSRLDFVCDARQMKIGRLVGDESDVTFHLMPDAAQAREFLPSNGMPIAVDVMKQIGQRVSPVIPGGFLSDLAATRSNRCVDLLNGLMHDTGRRAFVRCLDGRIRAYLSARYRVLDHYDIAFAALGAAQEVGATVFESSLNDQRMRMKFINQSLADVIDRGNGAGGRDAHHFIRPGNLGSEDLLTRLGVTDEEKKAIGTVWPAVQISNSETGYGGLQVRIGLVNAVCFNFAISEAIVREIHVGETKDEGVYSEETVAADSRVTMMKACDAIKAAFTAEHFEAMLSQARKAASVAIEAPAPAVDNIVSEFNISQERRDSILSYFIKDYNPNAWGLAQAVARVAQDEGSSDVAETLEIIAGSIIKNPKLAIAVA